MRVRRIVVRLDSAHSNRAVLDPAAVLATRLEAELVGLFVEDENLLNFAAFPFAHEVGFPSATRRPLDVTAMSRSLRALAAEARNSLALAARASSVCWSFEVTRCAQVGAFLSAVGAADLVIASILLPQELARFSGVQIVRAGDPQELRAALEQDVAGILLLTGGNPTQVGETLRRLLALPAR
jgi:hypothetical protein